MALAPLVLKDGRVLPTRTCRGACHRSNLPHLSCLLHRPQVELLTAKLAAEAEARRALQVQLAEQRRELEAAVQQLGETYEARLCELRQQLREAAAQGGRVRMSIGERLAAGETRHGTACVHCAS